MMIRSRTLTEDRFVCARCKHLRYASGRGYFCNVDGADAPDSGAICITTCDKFMPTLKEGKDHGRI